MKLSIVSTLYQSSEFVDELLNRTITAAQAVTDEFEVVLVDDGSPDDSLERALAHVARDHRIRVIELARNFGHHSAILTGLAAASGEFVFLIDSDLEEDPELVKVFFSTLQREKADVVFGVHAPRSGSRVHQWTHYLFWKFFNIVSDVKSPENICSVRLMSQQFVSVINSLPEKNIFLAGLLMWPGFRQVPVHVDRRIRRKRSTYSPWKRFSLAVRAFVAFSAQPLVAVFFVGCLIASISFAVMMYFAVLRILYPDEVLSGFTALIVSVWFLGGLTIASVGVVGLYVAHVYTEVKSRPRAIIKTVHTTSSLKDLPGRPTAGR